MLEQTHALADAQRCLRGGDERICMHTATHDKAQRHPRCRHISSIYTLKPCAPGVLTQQLDGFIAGDEGGSGQGSMQGGCPLFIALPMPLLHDLLAHEGVWSRRLGCLGDVLFAPQESSLPSETRGAGNIQDSRARCFQHWNAYLTWDLSWLHWPRGLILLPVRGCMH